MSKISIRSFQHSAAHFMTKQRYLAAIGGVIALLVGSAQGQQFNLPLASSNVTLYGNSDNYVSVPVHRPAVFQGHVQSVSGNVVTVQGTPEWATGPEQFVYVQGTQSNTYYVEFNSGSKIGMIYTVTDNGSNTLTLNLNGDALDGSNGTGAVATNDAISIVPYWTLGTLFSSQQGIVPSTNVTGSGDCTQILTYDSVPGANRSPSETYYYFGGGSGYIAGWRMVGGGFSNLFDDTTVPPRSIFVLRQYQEGNSILSTLGVPPMNSRALTIGTLAANTTQDNIVATDVPYNLTYSQSNLYQSGAFGGTGDTFTGGFLWTYSSPTQIDYSASGSYVYWVGGGVSSGWYNWGSGAGPLDETIGFWAGTGFIIRKIATPTPTTSIWTIPVNYTPQFAGTSLFANGLPYPFVFCTDDNSVNTHTDAYVDASGDCLRLTGVTGSVTYTVTNASGTVVASGTYSSSSSTFAPQTGTVGSASDVQAPPAIWIGQSTPVLLEFQASVSSAGTTTVTYASSDAAYTATLSGASGTSTLSFTLLDSGSNTVASGTYYGSTSNFSISGGSLDVRPMNGDLLPLVALLLEGRRRFGSTAFCGDFKAHYRASATFMRGHRPIN